MRWVMIIAGLLLTGFLAYRSEQVQTMLHGSEASELATLRVSRATLTDATVAIGTIKPKVGAEVKVGSQVSGIVGRLDVNIGDKVRKGQVLASLRDEDLRARSGALRAELASATAELEYAEGDLARKEQLADLLPRNEVEDARRNVKVKRAAVERVRSGLADANITLGYTVIRAPISGTIASVSTYEGETVAASFAAPTFVTIVDLDRLEVQSFVDETDIGKVKVGQRVTFRVDAFAGQELDGVVRAIYPKAQLVNNVVNYVVILDIVDRKGLLLRPEMTVQVSFILEQREDVVSVPRQALFREGGRTFVVVKSGDEWKERPVQLGLQTPQRIEIVSGLKAGETIVADKQAWKDHLEKSST
jgi:HlyD family secretion protein